MPAPRLSTSLLALALGGLPCLPSLWAQVTEPTVISIDVKPGSDVNSLNVKSRGRTSVVLLCDATFDPATVDVTTVMLEDARGERCVLDEGTIVSAVSVLPAALCQSLVCEFRTHDIGVMCDTTEVTLTATTLDGESLTGTDVVRPVPCQEKKK